MRHRINERNIGNITLDNTPKKRRKKLTDNQLQTIAIILDNVYNSMQFEQDLNLFVDGGRITLALSGEQMFDVFQFLANK